MRALPMCTPIVVHANGAITVALENDRSIGIISHNLRAVNFDNLNSMQRRNTIEEMMRSAGRVREASKAADDEVKRLREMAAASNDPQRKAELKAFSDALGGAIYRQKKVAAEFMRDVTILQGRVEADEVRSISAEQNRQAASGSLGTMPRAQTPSAPQSWNDAFRSIAEDLDSHQQAILSDEGVAADHSIAATAGC